MCLATFKSCPCSVAINHSSKFSWYTRNPDTRGSRSSARDYLEPDQKGWSFLRNRKGRYPYAWASWNLSRNLWAFVLMSLISTLCPGRSWNWTAMLRLALGAFRFHLIRWCQSRSISSRQYSSLNVDTLFNEGQMDELNRCILRKQLLGIQCPIQKFY